MGVFLTSFFVILAPAPAIAGWLFDRSGDAFQAILFATALLAATALANVAFRAAQKAFAARLRLAGGRPFP